MENKLELELYTRPTCSDCQAAKKYIAIEGIQYANKDVSKNPSLEEDLKKISGNRIVPMFAFYKRGLFGKKKLVKHFIGFENNKREIMSLLNKK
ncbi:glutaredoxin family protein [Virgibacillus sp. 179-BFC.A HS]|uniref:Glutaredoxin family protein n=1 Tax=Tigheibacillus jepli TaxID=3035914 RepID=A0ABU5CNY2_9BACI|nr:glutaredoxin family protein [Virgibacillus sp. 179-BFC.A HS]MDY0407185.1 glutaredoxin family protein [Virgibacillus sp. 179-BFC.A HS]